MNGPLQLATPSPSPRLIRQRLRRNKEVCCRSRDGQTADDARRVARAPNAKSDAIEGSNATTPPSRPANLFEPAHGCRQPYPPPRSFRSTCLPSPREMSFWSNSLSTPARPWIDSACSAVRLLRVGVTESPQKAQQVCAIGPFRARNARRRRGHGCRPVRRRRRGRCCDRVASNLAHAHTRWRPWCSVRTIKLRHTMHGLAREFLILSRMWPLGRP